MRHSAKSLREENQQEDSNTRDVANDNQQSAGTNNAPNRQKSCHNKQLRDATPIINNPCPAYDRPSDNKSEKTSVTYEYQVSQ
jgi:hypothetical protein